MGKAYFDLQGSERSFIDKIVPIRIVSPTPKNTGNSSNVPKRVSQVSSQKTSSSPIVIQVTNEGIFLNGKICPINQLAEKLKPLITKNPNSVVNLKVDKETKMGIITDVKVQMGLASVRKFNYQNRSGLSMNLRVTKESIFFNDKLCPLDKLAVRIKPFLKENPDATLYLNAQDLTLELVDDVLEQFMKVGLKNIRYSS